MFPRENYEAMDYAVPEANMEETWKNMNLEVGVLVYQNILTKYKYLGN